MTHVKTFAGSIKNYVQGIDEVTEEDKTILREKWESTDGGLDDQPDYGLGGSWADSDPLDPFGMGNLYAMPGHAKPPKVDAYGEPVGVTPRLMKVRLFRLDIPSEL